MSVMAMLQHLPNCGITARLSGDSPWFAIPERYRHAVRSFGLFAPRGMQKTLDAVFAILGKSERPRPKPRCWAQSIMRDFKRDPLLDSKGKRLTWVRRIAPK